MMYSSSNIIHKRIYTSIITLLFCFGNAMAQKSSPLQVSQLVCEYRTNPVSIESPLPRLSWKLISQERNTLQTAYEVRVGANAGTLTKDKDLVWRSGKISSDQSVHVRYAGDSLTSRRQYYWQVRVWDNKGRVSAWSTVNSWKMGLLHPGDWTAKWIQDNYPSDTTGGPSPMFRKTFTLAHAVRSAHLYITAHGVFEAQVNGARVGDDYFTPGFTSYNKRLQYQVYDVTKQLKQGNNAIGVSIGDGWYRGYTYDLHKNVYGKKLALLAQLEVEYTNGEKAVINTDNSWKVAYGPIVYNSFFDGETYDARKEKPGWATAAYNDTNWDAVNINDSIKSNLIALSGPPVKKHETFKPLQVITTPEGDRVIDFGQNLVGWVQFTLKGKAGDTLKLFHAEVLDHKGNFYTENLRSAKQEISYIFKSDAVETYEPHFTFQGFRYLKIVGYKGPIDATTFVAHALYSDMTQTGSFSSSNPLVNQLQHNILWGQKGNFVDIPTDCPQRDERMGWTGDAQVFCRTASFNMDVSEFFAKWLKDLAADQLHDGAVPYVIPNVLDSSLSAATGWSDASTTVPWDIYQAYGDKQVLEDQYNSMKAWVGYIQHHSHNDLWNTGSHFGDWLSYGGTDYAGAANTDKGLIAQAFYAHSTQLVINAAAILGKTEDVKTYTALLANIKSAFLKEYVTPGGRMISGTQTAYVLALNFDMLPEEIRASAAHRLVQNIEEYEGHITTGFLGAPYICHVLSRFGYTDIAYGLLTKESYPSWLYPVKNGATTIWERLDGIKTDKTFQDAGMNSFNHYSYGAVGDWMYRVVAGINTDETAPGFHKMIIAPKPSTKLPAATGELETLYGKVRSAWTLDNNIFTLDITVPPNTTALIVLPKAPEQVMENEQALNTSKDVSNINRIGNDLQLNAGSGNYHFVYTIDPNSK